MDMVRVGQAVASGVSIVCATCNKYWEGRERGLPDPKCTVVKPCGSPFAKLTFPEYEGPITDFTRWCFVCGAKATLGIKVREEPRVIGMCKQHVGMLEEIEPVGLKANGEAVADIIDRMMGRVSQKQYFGKPQRTLSQVIAETEAELAEDS
jgi:hypothetical protein